MSSTENKAPRQLRLNDKYQSKHTHGPYYRGDGFTFLSDEIVQRELTGSLKITQLHFLLCLTREVWRRKNIVLTLARSYMMAVSKVTRTTMERHLSALIDHKFMVLEQLNRNDGNTYLVEPVLIWSSKLHELANIERSRLVQPLLLEPIQVDGELSLEELEASIQQAEIAGHGHLTSALRALREKKINNQPNYPQIGAT